ncbi:hypothetical protein GPUN_1260 [Glaciecola punicea ACAM 611]|uniref:Uncharacterized protein n=1 Tax=Glaciecola punicea ACAM 611 TaxID=1121923 RepID=H5TAQ7_9ALTE|nr:hypothetical protein GPUN_1260 [Glaciecola punicea ACAM 611]
MYAQAYKLLIALCKRFFLKVINILCMQTASDISRRFSITPAFNE